MGKLKGKGELVKCPACKSDDIEVIDRAYGGQTVLCNKCDKKFVETWEAVSWEEV